VRGLMNGRLPISAFDYPARSALDTNWKAHDLDKL
jgi:hypothetical protein